MRSRCLLPIVLVVCAAFGASAPVLAADVSPTVVLVVRHAEKASDHKTDPNLDPAGLKRAEQLAVVAAAAGVAAIYTTEFKRTQQTAAPLAKLLGVTPVIMPREGKSVAGHVAEIVADLRAKQSGKSVLVVGHSDTVPMLVEALGGPRPPAIDEREFDRLLVVIVPPSGPAKVVAARYGAASSPD